MIICLGTTPTLQRTMNFARLELDAVNRATSIHEFASGKSINAARTAHEMGEAVLATGFLGGDRGRLVRRDLDQSKIPHDFVDVETETRLCMTVIDQSRGSATELIEESKPAPRDAYDRLLEKLGSLLHRASAMVLSGTLPPDAPEHFYADCVSLAGDRIPIILDARDEPLNRALQRRPLLVKPNRAELSRMAGVDAQDDEAVRHAMTQLVQRGAQWVVVTAGKEPTLVTDGERFWQIPTPRVEAVNPIGSGDAFAAGLAVALVRGEQMPQACVLGAACGAANAMTAHAGHVRAADVRMLAERIQLEAV